MTTKPTFASHTFYEGQGASQRLAARGLAMGKAASDKIPSEVLKLNERKFKTYIKNSLSKQAYYKLEDYIQDKNAWKHAGPAP